MEVGLIRHLRRPRYELPIAHLPASMRGMRILHLSDIHLHRTWMPAWTELLRWIADEPPDLICLTGDLVDRKHDHRPAMPLVKRFIDGLHARLGVWGVLGNHDTDLLPLRANDLPVRWLYNESVTLHDQDAVLEISGVHGVHPSDFGTHFRGRIARTPDATPRPLRLVMSHYPVHAVSLAQAGVDLVLSGHTHGGQICLPGGVPILTHDHMPRRFARGAHRIGETWLITSRGCGFSKFPVRVFCPAEAVEVILTSPA